METKSQGYQMSVKRANPACVLFLVDRSAPAQEDLPGIARTRSNGFSEIVNRLISDWMAFCEKGEETPRDWCSFGVIEYAAIPRTRLADIGPALRGASETLVGRDVVSIVDLYNDPLLIEKRMRKFDNGEGGLVEMSVNFPVWYRSRPDTLARGRPTCEAFAYVRDVAASWCAQHQDAFPPMVFHLTNGKPTDGDPEPYATSLKELSTNDGNLMLYQVAALRDGQSRVCFPTNEDELLDDWTRQLFRMSSELSDVHRDYARNNGIAEILPGARALLIEAEPSRWNLIGSMLTPIHPLRSIEGLLPGGLR